MAPAVTVTIGSKLPNGLILRHPLKKDVTVEIKGLNSAPKTPSGEILTIPYATTEVDKDFWDAWFLVHNHDSESKRFAALKSGALFVAKNAEHAADIAKEKAKLGTGLQPLSQNKDPRLGADGAKLQKADKED